MEDIFRGARFEISPQLGKFHPASVPSISIDYLDHPSPVSFCAYSVYGTENWENAGKIALGGAEEIHGKINDAETPAEWNQKWDLRGEYVAVRSVEKCDNNKGIFPEKFPYRLEIWAVSATSGLISKNAVGFSKNLCNNSTSAKWLRKSCTGWWQSWTTSAKKSWNCDRRSWGCRKRREDAEGEFQSIPWGAPICWALQAWKDFRQRPDRWAVPFYLILN